MTITICGSITFAPKLVEIYHKLKELGHEPKMHKYMFGIADGTAHELLKEIKKEHSSAKRKYNLIKWWHDSIKESDAVLICNFDKGHIKNHIGGNTLMEIGFAHVNDKKVFLLNPIPKDISYIDEIKAMTDTILNGNLKLIK